MKRLFKLGLVALMGVCGLVGISRAQDIVLTVDTTASTNADCTLNAETGVWSTQGSDAFGLKLKVLNGTEGQQYRVSFTCKDADGNDAFEEDAELTSTLTGLAWSSCMTLASGTYTFVFTLEDRVQGSSDYATVEGVGTLTVQVKVVTPAFKITTNPAYTEMDGEKTNMVGQMIQYKRWIFPSNSKPVFTIEIEDGTIAEDMLMISVTPEEGEEKPIYYAVAEVEASATNYTFTLAPMDLDDEDGDEEAESLSARAAEFMPDGKYEMQIMDMTYNLSENYFLGFGSFPVYGFEAVGATTETMEGDEYKKFATDEAVFAVKAENAPANWFAVVSVLDVDRNFLASDTLRTKDSIATFTTLTGGEFYYALCKVYNIDGTDTTMVWSNGDGYMSMGMAFQITGEILPTDPELTVTPADNGTKGADGVITFDSVAKFTLTLSGFGEDETAGDFQIEYKVYTKEAYNAESFDPVASGLYENEEIALYGVYNGEYVATFTVSRIAKVGEATTELYDSVVYFTVTNYEEEVEEYPEFAVKAVGNTEEDGKIIFADGKAAFDMFVIDLPEGDTTYKIHVSVSAGENDFPMPDIMDAADSIRYENTYFNGEYKAVFELVKRNRRGGYDNVADTTIDFSVTEGEVRPELTVKALSETMQHDTVIFADGNAAFDMFVEGVAATDTTYALYVTVWNMADENIFPEPTILEYADSVRFESTYFNGTYEATFELMRRTQRGEYINVTDQKIIFAVTEGEDRPEIAVKPVGNTEEDGKIIFADGKAAFDMFVKGIKVEAGDDTTYKLYVTIWNAEDDNDFPEPIVLNYADSVRYEVATAYTNGTYEAAFELMKRDSRGGYMNVADQTITFYVTENVAVERNAELAGVNVYPNPSNGNFNVAVPERARIDIFGLNGAKVMSREVNAGVESFNINHSGIYFVRVMAGNKTAVKRVVVR